MTLTKDAPTSQVVHPPETEDGWLSRPIVLVALALVLLAALGWGFLADTSMTAPTRDPAWYSWRANVIMEGAPGRLAQGWGPGGVFAGGYRVSVPLAGAMLRRIAGIDRFTFSAFMMIGIPVLTGLALGAFAYRQHRDPLLFLLVLFATVGLFLTTPFVGYLDNITVLFVLSSLLAFYPAARTSWGARSAVFLLAVLAAFTHPTTCVFFGLAMMAAFGVSFLTSRFRIAPALKRYGPSLLTTGAGMVFGFGLWVVGIWGPAGSLKDAAVPPPYTRDFFLNRLAGWFASLEPLITFPLIALAIGWTVWRARRDRQPSSEFGALSIAWLLPLLGALGFLFVAKPYPYYRFVNATAAFMGLAGLGAWVALRWLLRGEGPRRVVGLAGCILIVVALGFVINDGLQHRWTTEKNQWINQETRAALAAVHEIVARTDPDQANVFVVNYRDDPVAYGWAKTFTNVARNGLPGPAAQRSATFFGSVHDFLAGRPTEGNSPEYTKVSKMYFGQLGHKLSQYADGKPVVFLIRGFYRGSVDADADLGRFTRVTPDVSVVTGPDLASPSPRAVAAAKAASDRVAARLSHPARPWENPLHTLRVLGGLFLLVVLPGLIASKWFEIDDPWTKIALIPGVSMALVILSAIAVIAVTRNAFSSADAWISLAIATGVAAGLAAWRRRLLRPLQAFSGFFNRMFAVFSNRSFAALMGVQFVAQMADGMVQGSLAKAIAIGNEKGFDVANVPSTRYLLIVVLALYVPYTFVSPFVGVFVDRFERRRLLVVSNLFRAAVVAMAAIALTGLGDRLSDVVPILAILIALACTRMLLAIKSAGLPAVLQGKDLLQGNGLSQAGGAIFQLFGGGLAFVATGGASAGLVALVGAGLYAVAAIVAKQIDRLEYTKRATAFGEEVRRIVRDIGAGLREVVRRPAAALGLTSFQALRMEFFGFVALVFALQARNLLTGAKGGDAAVAVAGATGAVGAAIGMVVAQKFRDHVPPIRLLLSAMGTLGVGVILFGGVQSIAGYAAITFVGAFGFFLGKISADTIMQQALPDDFRGRGFSLFDIAYNLGWIVPALILSLIWSENRVRPILIASGVAFLVVTALIWAWSGRIGDQLARGDDVAEPVPADTSS